jgi:mono/diheme cytochrome c family protein
MNRPIYLFFALIFFGCLPVLTYSQATWTVSSADAAKKNPVPANDKSVNSGKSLYNAQCKSCHGDPGKGNGLPLVPKPQDPTSDIIQKNSDGALLYKISKGRGAMPRFKDVIKDEDKWNIINYIRSLKKGKTASADISAPDATIKGFKGKVELAFRFVDSTKTIIVKAVNPQEGVLIPVPGLGITVFAKRYFRDLKLNADALITNADGEVEVDFPGSLPGDSIGNVLLHARVTEGVSDSVAVSAQIGWGKPFVYINPRSERSLWNSTWMAPWWLLLSYFGVVIGVWGTIFYIVLEVGKLKKIGSQQAS